MRYYIIDRKRGLMLTDQFIWSPIDDYMLGKWLAHSSTDRSLLDVYLYLNESSGEVVDNNGLMDYLRYGGVPNPCGEILLPMSNHLSPGMTYIHPKSTSR